MPSINILFFRRQHLLKLKQFHIQLPLFFSLSTRDINQNNMKTVFVVGLCRIVASVAAAATVGRTGSLGATPSTPSSEWLLMSTEQQQQRAAKEGRTGYMTSSLLPVTTRVVERRKYPSTHLLSTVILPLSGGGTQEKQHVQQLDDVTKEGNLGHTTSASAIAAPLSQTNILNKNREAPLLEDIELLSNLLSDLVKTEDATVHDLYEFFRLAGLERASYPNSTAPLERMITTAANAMTADQAVGVMRTFSIMLNLVNSAEVSHRTRVTQQHDIVAEQQQQYMNSSGPLPLIEDSMRGTIDALLSNSVATPQQIYDQLLRQKVEIVLTAHPTQVQRKSLLRKYRKISETLQTRNTAVGYAKNVSRNSLARIISSIWGADEIRRSKPTPQQEAAGGNAVIETVLWDAVPTYLRKLHTQCSIQLGRPLPVDCCPIRFASWIGGDRDGTCNGVLPPGRFKIQQGYVLLTNITVHAVFFFITSSRKEIQMLHRK
jgi:Phosphoenolpyruvate carboxylase